MLEVLYVIPVSFAVSMVTAVQTCMFVVLTQALEEKAIYFTWYITIGMTCLTQLLRGNGPWTMDEKYFSWCLMDSYWLK